jgi:hypothetical protein
MICIKINPNRSRIRALPGPHQGLDSGGNARDKLRVLDRVFYKADQYQVVSMIMGVVPARNSRRDWGSSYLELLVECAVFLHH